ncbi:hypothetical protein EEB18_018545 [Sphingopyxis sp. OPL5]|uniref:hypothetical protein n=1 Tax=Sphingopyxis sp. OPL5 TaxID=2486273 RepID=UPI00164E07B2|nr:hypothetical protein [Sphingopyxis sp. OPL5]QNO26706.1 hypothetical protein EEB18_018545 [Sphingopyxis sp. OPL5]
MAQKRNYRSEYKRRLANAKKRGLSRSQARGHARPGEAALRPKPTIDTTRLEAALSDMRQSGALTTAAKSHRIAPERLRRYIRELGLAKREGRAWTFTDKRLREMTTISGGEVYKIKIIGWEESSLNGDYLSAVRTFLRLNDYDLIAPFVGRSVIDAKGKAHPFETRPNTLHRLAASQSGNELFHQVYRLVS